MEVTLAFYKGSNSLNSLIIKAWTRSKYSHVEMIIEDKWVSSSPDVGGVTIKDLHELNHKDWDYIDIEVDGRKLRKVLKFIEENKNAKYDWLGLFAGTVFSQNIEDKDKFFCSEMMTIILQIFNETKVKNLIPNEITPEDLHKLYKGINNEY